MRIYFDKVAPNETIDVYVIGNETNVPWGRGYEWNEDMKIDDSKLQPNTYLCYSPLRALKSGFCEARSDAFGLGINVSF